MNREGVIGSLKEVSDYGALVSKEAELLFSLTTWGNPAQWNRIALTHFFDNIIRWSDFDRVFFWFLTNHFQDYANYLSTLVYPGETLEINPMGTMNVWWWPQIMIPREVSLEDCKWILVRTHKEYEYVMSILSKQWVGIPVSSLQSFLASFGKASRLPDESTDNFIIAMNLLTNEFFAKYRV